MFLKKFKLNIVSAILLIVLVSLPVITTIIGTLMFRMDFSYFIMSLIRSIVHVALTNIPYIFIIVALFKNKKIWVKWAILAVIVMSFVSVASGYSDLGNSFLFVVRLLTLGVLFGLTFVNKNKDNVKWLWKAPVILFVLGCLIPLFTAIYNPYIFSGFNFSLDFILYFLLYFFHILSVILYPVVWILLTFWLLGEENTLSMKEVNKRKLSSKNESKEEKIKALRNLYQSGGITEEEYKKKMVALLKNKK